MRGNLITVSAPSGAGKTSLVKALVEADGQLRVSVSHTTRPQRPGEIDGTNYNFVQPAEFQRMVDASAFLEHATVFGNAYGTSRQWVNDTLEQGHDVILEIDWQGAEQARLWLADIDKSAFGTSIFILPPSLDALRARLNQRGQDNEDTIARRMAEAVSEMSHFGNAEFVVVNDDFDTAVAELQAIITGCRLRLAAQQERHGKLLGDLLRNSPATDTPGAN